MAVALQKTTESNDTPWRKWATLLAATAAAILVTGCGVDPGESKSEMATNESSSDVGACVQNFDCGEGAYCHRPSTCGEPNFCKEGHAPISAAPPIAVCRCDGTTGWANHGYPGPHAWEIGSLVWNIEDGEPCDPDAEPPHALLLRFHIVEGFSGQAPTLARLEGSVDAEMRVKSLSDDGTVEFEATAHSPWANYGIRVFEDRDGDGECLPETDVSYDAYEIAMTANLVDFSFDIDIEIRPETTACGGW
jgi:hypothetical protein